MNTNSKSYSIKSAAAELNLSEVYIRRMIQQGKLPTVKAQVGDSEVWRHEISAEVLEAWRKGASVHTVRTDGRSKFTLYATAAELAAIQQLLTANSIGAVVEKANKPEDVKRRYAKSKIRRAAKKAALKAVAQSASKPVAK
jgi:hypothetical protein